MGITVTTPGVYIEELKSQTLSITSGATAVPVFACAAEHWPVAYTTGGTTVPVPDTSKPIRVNNWLEFSKLYMKDDDTEEGDVFFTPPTTIQVSLKAYFDNGGGYCYIAQIADTSAVGLTQTNALDDITLIVAAGCGIETSLTTLLLGVGRFALLEPDDVALVNISMSTTSRKDMNCAYYYPWLTASWAKNDVAIPPSAAIAGVICSVDRKAGPWQAPANVALLGGLTPKYRVTDDEQELYMQGAALNMIREFTGTGVLVWGARTTTADDDEWRYVPVRRLFSAVEKDLKRTLMFSVFEPNSQPTWERVRGAIDSYLNGIWQSGGLMGASTAEAYYVQVGLGTTMTAEDVSQGKMIIKIGMAAVRPAEFIILQFTQDMQHT
ncbi:MAG: phage tail sheath family protein [Rhodobacteraceae bacterium]|nr:phage tail sheath family protein [Paracoccaceae bacterium]